MLNTYCFWDHFAGVYINYPHLTSPGDLKAPVSILDHESPQSIIEPRGP